MFERGSGILAHPTSFETEYGIGDFGSSTVKFLNFLEKTNQKYWQILPLGPTSFGDSPYQCFSTFAGNTLLISPEILLDEKLITEKDLVNELSKECIDYGNVIKFKNDIFKKAFDNFNEIKTKKDDKKFQTFKKENEQWLSDYCLFIALKQYYIEKRSNTFETVEYKSFAKENKKYLTKSEIDDYFYGGMWLSFDKDIKNRENNAVKEWTKLLEKEIELQKFLQYKFFEQWEKIKTLANKKNIQIIGDIPIFVSMDSSDVWVNKNLFNLDKYGRPTKVAGVPPDYFSKDGQLWGNPLYDFSVHKKDDYKWWTQRIESANNLYDIIRIDHFRGFSEYWSIPYGEETAINGKWEKGPADSFFDSIFKKLPNIKIIAEDLGDLSEDVAILRDKYNLPGMKILQFAFSDASNEYLPHNFSNKNCVVYTGTHDNDTTKGFYEKATEEEKDYIRRYLNVSGENVVYDLIRLCYSSSADICIIPIQDILELNSNSRMNTPSKKDGNWQFRYFENNLNEECSQRLNYLVKIFNR